MGSLSVVDRDRVVAALTATADIGPYFRVRVEDDACGVRFAEVADADLTRYAQAVCRHLASQELRVGVSTWQFGLAARIWSVAMGCWATSRVVPELRGLVLVDDEDRSRLAMCPAGGWAVEDADPDVVARVLGIQVLGALRPLHERLVEVSGIAAGLLDGNAAAAVAGAAASLQRFGQQRYRVVRELEPLVTRLLQLDGVREWLEPAPPGSGSNGLRRRTCCLYYRTPVGGTCGDCPVQH